MQCLLEVTWWSRSPGWAFHGNYPDEPVARTGYSEVFKELFCIPLSTLPLPNCWAEGHRPLALGIEDSTKKKKNDAESHTYLSQFQEASGCVYTILVVIRRILGFRV